MKGFIIKLHVHRKFESNSLNHNQKTLWKMKRDQNDGQITLYLVPPPKKKKITCRGLLRIFSMLF